MAAVQRALHLAACFLQHGVYHPSLRPGIWKGAASKEGSLTSSSAAGSSAASALSSLLLSLPRGSPKKPGILSFGFDGLLSPNGSNLPIASPMKLACCSMSPSKFSSNASCNSRIAAHEKVMRCKSWRTCTAIAVSALRSEPCLPGATLPPVPTPPHRP